eukprot:TRINITY_DN1651_c0_g1_i1.p1 TRINITY_DN1651_c0_g1~~TRINITY_DN1651_c0_g1_i1.p1  ORF type:complete len:697 (+),score=255.87 TRINITY_DN1651_c0_g1_i1:97-2187(+)
MQFRACAILLLFVAAASAAKSGSEEHPIKRVISLIKALADKAKAEGIAEADTYEEYTHWCGKTVSKLEPAIKKEKEMIASMESKEDARKSEKKVLGRELDDLKKSLAHNEKAAEEAKTSREEANAEWISTNQDLQDTIDALGQAIKGLVDSENPDAVGLAAKGASVIIEKPLALAKMSKDEQQALIQMAQEPSPLSGKGPAARKYDFKSNNIINMLKKMKMEFENEQQAKKMEEMAAAQEYTALKGVSDEEHTVATEAKEKKTAIVAEVEGILAQLSTDLANTKEDLATDSKSLADTQMSCKVKSDEFKQRVYMRKQEQEALAYGIKILQKVTGVRSAVPAATSFLQLGSHHRGRGYAQRKKAAAEVRAMAKKLHSTALRRVAQFVEKKINAPGVAVQLNMTIEAQVAALKDEQLAEDKKNKWCQTEINKTNEGIEQKTQKMEDLKDDQKVGIATVEELTVAIDTANQAVNDLTAQLHEATLVRQSEKTENGLAIEDAQDAQEALKNAIATLEKYYADAKQLSDAAGLIQVKAPTETAGAPPSWDKASFEGSGESSVIAVLEESNADFGKMEVETKAKEEGEATAFAQFKKDTEDDMARRNNEIQTKTEERTQMTEKVVQWKKDWKLTDREKELLKQYLRDMDAECNGGAGGTYEDRKAARTEEMEALQSAKETLGAAFAPSLLAQSAKTKAFLKK